jgi:hypothetical protein
MFLVPKILGRISLTSDLSQIKEKGFSKYIFPKTLSISTNFWP